MYEDLFDRILTAQDMLLREGVRANTVVINGKKYGRLANDVNLKWRTSYTPAIFGMAVDVDSLPDDYDFVVLCRAEPPRSDHDKLRDKIKELIEKLDKIQTILEEYK